jgi:cyanophycin synthetase
VAQLIAAENGERGERGTDAAQTLVKMDPDLRMALRRCGLRLSSVPPAGARVRVKQVVNDNRREENVPAMDAICPALAETARRASAALGLRFAGVDIITTDPSLPLHESGGVVLELNAGPGLYYHYMTSAGGRPVARLVLERLAAHAGAPD